MKARFLIIAGALFAAATVCADKYETKNLTNAWTAVIGGHCDCSPAIAPDGTIYTGSWTGKFFAIEPGGRVAWTFRTETEIKSSPAIANDGTIYFGSRNNNFYALQLDGKLKWTFKTGAWVDSSPALAKDGTIYFGSWDKTFYALNPDGSKKWTFDAGGEVDSSPAIAADGTIYFGSHDKVFYALNPDGSKKWGYKTGGQIISSPAIGAEGAIVFTSTDGKLYCLNPDGSLRWQLRTGGVTGSSPVIDVDGDIRLGVNANFAGVTAEGKIYWVTPSETMVKMTPAIAGNHMVYMGSAGGALYALLPTPELATDKLHRIGVIDDRAASSPAITPDGTIYLLGENGTLDAIKGDAPLAKSSWPMFRGNPRHTGNVADNGK